MKKILIFLYLISHSAIAQTNIQKIDSLLSYYNREDKIMGQFAIKLGNSTVYQKTLGSNHPDIKVNNETRYRIGSITKMFTATMIMQLVEEKKLKLTDKLSKFYPKIDQANNITIEMLLRHRSGINDYINSDQALDANNLALTKQDVINTINTYKSIFEPDSKTQYSNSNYFLLGQILEQITQKNYSENLIARICKPLNLYYTTLSNNPIDINKKEINSYTVKNSTWEVIPQTNTKIPDAAGGIISTANDLTTFIHALFSYKLVKKETLEVMMQTKNGFGLGLTVIPFGDRKFYGHVGRIDGFETSVAYYPNEKLSYAALYNGVNTNTNEVNIAILSIYYHQPYTFPDLTDLEINESILNKYVGIYKSDALPIKIKIFVQNSKLYAQAAGQSSFPLSAKSETVFTFDPAKIKMTFKNNEFTLNQSNTEYVFIKD